MSNYICVKKIGEHDLEPPTRGTEHAAGYDLTYSGDREITLRINQTVVVPTGFAWQLPEDTVGIIKSRSGLARSHGIDILGGVIDCDYRGEVQVLFANGSNNVFVIKPGMRIAQMVILPCFTYNTKLSIHLDDSHRGSDGFGSTGIFT